MAKILFAKESIEHMYKPMRIVHVFDGTCIHKWSRCVGGLERKKTEIVKLKTWVIFVIANISHDYEHGWKRHVVLDFDLPKRPCSLGVVLISE